jgi:hypothetical protein
MARMVTWFGIGLLSIALLGCADPPNKINGVGGGGGGGGGAPAAPAAPMPGMPMPGAPGMAPMAGHAAVNPAAAAPVVPIRDPLVFLPANLTFAVGGKPAAATQAKSKLVFSLLEQFGPLTNALAKIGLPPQEFEAFWAGGNHNMSEQALCVVTKSDINVQALRLALQAEGVPAESKVWPLPGAAGSTHALALADNRTVIIGRRATVDAALRKTPSAIIKQGLASVNSPDADFWISGDAVAAQIYLKGGFPLVGTYSQPINKLTGFGVAMTLEGHPPAANTANGGMGMPGMNPSAAMHGAAAMPMTSANPSAAMHAAPMPMATANPSAAMHASPMPMPGATPAAAMHAAPMPMATATATPGVAMHAAPGAVPGAAGAAPAAPIGGDQTGILVIIALTFDSEPSATAVHLPLETFLASSGKRFSPKLARFIPDLGGGGGANPAGAAPGMMVNPTAAMHAAPRPGMQPGSPGSPDANGAAGGPKIAVILDPKPAGTPPPADPRLTPIAPPQPMIAAAPGTPGAAGDPMAPMPGAAMHQAASPSAAMHQAAPPGAAMHQAAPPGAAMHQASMAAPGMMNGPGMGGPGMGGPTVPWVHQQGPLLHFGYRFDARDESIAIAGHLLRALGVTPQGSPLASGPLADLYRATQEWRAKGLDEAKKAKNGFGPRGTSWMVHLLPHLGHASLYKKFNFSKPMTDEPNANLTHEVIPEFLNPADSRQQWQGVPYADKGLTHFVGISGVEDEAGPPAATLDRKDPKAGIFGYKDVATPEMITDGQSQTMMLIGSGRMAAPWSVGGGATIRGVRSGSFNPQTGFGSVGGPKPGAFVLFADGSVRFVSADIDEKVLKAMSTTHGADTVDMPALQGSGSVLDKW